MTDAKNNLAQHKGYLPRQWVLGSSPRVLGHALEDSSDLLLLEPAGRAVSGNRLSTDICVGAIEVEANTKIRKSLMEGPDHWEVTTFLEMQYTTGEQVKESISRKDTGWDPLESLVLKVAICGC